jgi:hypothetical protein
MLRGTPVMMGSMVFLRKPYFDLGKMDRTSRMLVGKAQNLLLEVPEYVVFGDWENGASVLRWKGGVWMLDDNIPGYEIGKLKITGKGKYISREVEVCDFTTRALKWVQEGELFQFGKVSVELFNKAMNKSYARDDWFTMMEKGQFSYGAEVYSLYRLPGFSGDWSVVVDTRSVVDRTNEFESMYS